ncbi:hypothetical protein CLU79DRAFT_590731 [Phycomyces nitens]|nr:hypothetical protein CLU79DRAFT_590731 [Phycomyces nitens]
MNLFVYELYRYRQRHWSLWPTSIFRDDERNHFTTLYCRIAVIIAPSPFIHHHFFGRVTFLPHRGSLVHTKSFRFLVLGTYISSAVFSCILLFNCCSGIATGHYVTFKTLDKMDKHTHTKGHCVFTDNAPIHAHENIKKQL